MTADNADLVIDTSDAAQTMALGEAIGRGCVAGDVIALEGELGAGKTQLVRGLAQGMGIDARQVNSPTFVLMQEYEPVEPDGKAMLLHMDAYRMNSDEDLLSIGWAGQGEELREEAVIAIEWASLIEHALGDDVLWVTIAHESVGRRISLSARGAWRGRLQALSQWIRDAGLSVEAPSPSQGEGARQELSHEEPDPA